MIIIFIIRKYFLFFYLITIGSKLDRLDKEVKFQCISAELKLNVILNDTLYLDVKHYCIIIIKRWHQSLFTFLNQGIDNDDSMGLFLLWIIN